MSKIVGYGEDAFTLWFLKQHSSKILDRFGDRTTPSNCLVFYRPSFGRHSKKNSSIFGEFDAIISSEENIYLIESKWGGFTKSSNDEFTLREEQILRHKIFSWYLMHWDRKYSNDWQTFIDEHQSGFKFENKTLAPKGSLLAMNLVFILNKLLEHCRRFSSKDNIKNVLLFFYNAKKSRSPLTTSTEFTLVPVDYSEEILDNFVTLQP